MNGRAGRVDRRGSNAARKVRRTWLLSTFDVDLGPERARCHLKLSAWCERIVDSVSLSVDRIEPGGTYRRGNIQPACKPCQDRQGGLARVRSMDQLLDAYRCAREQWVIEFDLQCSMSYTPALLRRELRKARRGGRNEVYDYVESNPPPLFRDWLAEWYAEQREHATQGPAGGVSVESLC